MTTSMHPTRRAALLEQTDLLRPPMAKALRKADVEPFRIQLGGAIKRAQLRCQWSLKEFAAKVGRDERQVARWEDGTEPALWERLLSLDAFRTELLIALAEVCGDAVEIETTVTIKRRV